MSEELGQALKRAIERINELEAELHEQACVNGMGSEREARLMAVNAELVRALRVIAYLEHDIGSPPLMSDAEAMRLKARAALAKVGESK